MRTQLWLENKLEQIWQLLFPEVPKENNVLIKFKGKPKLRFGFIKKKDKDTLIAINSLFKSELVPEYVVDVTIAHELVHYSHGFHSPLPKKYKYPHQGNIVNKELRKRGFSFQLAQEKKWVKESWFKIYKELIN